MNRASVLILTLAAIMLLAACDAGQEPTITDVEPAAMSAGASGDADQMASDEMDSDEMDSEDMAAEDDSIAEQSDQPMDDQMADDAEAMAEGSEAMATGEDLPAWQTLPLTNARSGETFTLADFAGNTVFVEPMATWCTNCRSQLGNVKDAYAQLSGEDVVFVALSVETNISSSELASYADEAGFDWLFAVLSPEMLQALASEFGQTIANPPSTPHFVIRPDGSTSDLVTGIDPAEQIVAQIQAAQG